MKKLILLFVAGCVALAMPQQTFAWGKTGHEIVAEIAMSQLNDPVKQKVLQRLGSLSPEGASTWMDEMRSNHDYDYMKPWHYINIDKGKDYSPTTDENIVNQLIAARRDLKHQQTICSDEVKTDMLEFFHLAGDLHQPLHTGYDADRGGNSVKLTFLGKESNLHWVWDDEIIQQQHITSDDCMQLLSKMTEAQKAAIGNIDIVAWMNESRSLLDKVYAFNGNTIDEAYCIRNRPIIEQQLVYAGIRLAALLNEAFGTGTVQVAAAKPVPADGTVTPDDAINHIGQQVTVCGKVYGGKYLDQANGTPTFINMGAAYPNSPFTVVIFGSDRDKLSYKPETYLDGKTICVTGKVKEYKGKAEIVVSKEQQIKIN
ncbi:S1/P1 nuclease [Chitinophagaceae bacterium MMS25-I14]